MQVIPKYQPTSVVGNNTSLNEYFYGEKWSSENWTNWAGANGPDMSR